MEYRLVKLFRGWGYEARRIAGSHGPFDVIAMNRDDILFVQAKKYRGKRPNYAKDVASLAAATLPENSELYVAVWQEGKGWDIWIDARTGREISWRNPATQSSAKPPKKKG